MSNSEAKSPARRRSNRTRRDADPPSVLLPAVQAAKEYGIPYTTLRDLGLRGEIPVVRLGRAWYFVRADLARFIQRTKDRLQERS